MESNTEDLKNEALRVIEDKKLVFITEVSAFLPCVRATFYIHKLHEDQDIIDAIKENKIKIKAGLRKMWYDGENPTTQIALYKLISDDDEHDKLTMSNIRHSGDKDKPITIIDLGRGLPPDPED